MRRWRVGPVLPFSWATLAVIWSVLAFITAVRGPQDATFLPLTALTAASGVAALIAGALGFMRARDARHQRAYQALFAGLSDPMLIAGQDEDGSVGRFVRVNEAACAFFGESETGMLKRRLDETFFADWPRPVQSSLVRRLDERGTLGLDHVLPMADGTRTPVYLEMHSYARAERRQVVVVVKHLGDRGAAERALRRRERRLIHLAAAQHELNEVLEERTILQRAAASAMDVLGASEAMAGPVIEERIVFDEFLDTGGTHRLATEVTLAEGESAAGASWESGTAFVTNDAQREIPRCPAYDEVFQPISLVAVPILSRDGTTLGFLEVRDKLEGTFDEEDALVAIGLASSAATALENARARAELLEHRQRLRRLAEELTRMEEQERRRLAEQLHDRIGQELAVMKMRVAQLASMHPSPECAAPLGELRELLDSTIADTRALTFEISPPMLYTLGLAPALEWLAEQMEQQHGIAISVHNDTEGRRVSDDSRALLYISVRELLMNVAKHAEASSVEVRLAVAGEWLWVTVTDDGVGFAPPDLDSAGDGFGLFSVRERLTGIGGAMTIKSEPGRGTEVLLEAPLEPDP